MEKVIEMLKHYYEIDINNCEMTDEMWIEELAKAMTDPDYLKKFEKEYDQYLEEINA